MNYTIFLFGLCIGTIMDLVFTPSKKGKEGKYVSNLVVVNNTNSCNNKCTHIHHWIWGGLIVLYTTLLISPNHSITQFISGLWFGSFIAEYIQYGNNIFNITQECFTDCE